MYIQYRPSSSQLTDITSIEFWIFDLDFSALFIIGVITICLCFGVRDSSRLNVFLVCCTTVIILLTIIGNVSQFNNIIIFQYVGGSFFVSPSNWDNFLPMGVPGVFQGASLVFFAYVGFDAVTTVSEEMKNPKRVKRASKLHNFMQTEIFFK